MKDLLNRFLKLMDSKEEKKFYYVRIERNDKCYCDSGKKYKSCHFPDHQKKSKLAVKKINELTGEESIKVLSVKKLRKEHFRIKSNLIG